MMESAVSKTAGERSDFRRLLFEVNGSSVGRRLDQFISDRTDQPGISRSRLKTLFRDQLVTVNDRSVKPAYRLRRGDRVLVFLPKPAATELVPEPVDFTVLHEDEDLLVISKPPGVVVHPGCGHRQGTLVHGLLFHCEGLSGINGVERPGIVHRLDKDTSGIMVVAKTDNAHRSLSGQFKERQVSKSYRAIINGVPELSTGSIDLAIGRHPKNRRKMAVVERGGREAHTKWRLLESFPSGYSLLEVLLGTGRTHQIRVHLAALGFPIAGDELYGRQRVDEYRRLGIVRQCLHSYQLAFNHPMSGVRLEFTAPLSPDLLLVLKNLGGGEGRDV